MAMVLNIGNVNSVDVPGFSTSANFRFSRRAGVSRARHRPEPAQKAHTHVLLEAITAVAQQEQPQVPAVAGKARDGRGRAVHADQTLVVAEPVAHTGRKVAGVGHRAPRKIGSAQLDGEIELAIRLRHHAVQQIPASQHVEHFAHLRRPVVHHADIRERGQAWLLLLLQEAEDVPQFLHVGGIRIEHGVDAEGKGLCRGKRGSAGGQLCVAGLLETPLKPPAVRFDPWRQCGLGVRAVRRVAERRRRHFAKFRRRGSLRRREGEPLSHKGGSGARDVDPRRARGLSGARRDDTGGERDPARDGPPAVRVAPARHDGTRIPHTVISVCRIFARS